MMLGGYSTGRPCPRTEPIAKPAEWRDTPRSRFVPLPSDDK